MKNRSMSLLPLLLAVFVAAPAGAQDAGTDVRFTGGVGYQIVGDKVRLTALQIANYSLEDSGTLYLTLRMTESSDPFTEGEGYRVARASLDVVLKAGYQISNVSRVTEFTRPPDGTYYAHLYVSESPNRDTPLDIITFTNTQTFAPPPPPPESVDIESYADYAITGNRVNMRVGRIVNNTSSTTGTLHLSMRMTETSDPASDGHLVARASLEHYEGGGKLESGFYYANIDLNADYKRPPAGRYYVHLYVSESPDLDTRLDVRTGTSPYTVDAGRVEFIGASRYGIAEEEVTFEVDEIVNNSEDTTSTLHLTLRMTSLSDPESEGHDVARVSLAASGRTGQLPPGESYTNLKLSGDYTEPPPGRYWVHMYVSEASGLSTQLDSRTGFSLFTVARDDYGDTFEEATAVTPPTSIEGRLETAGDIDVFSITLDTPGTLDLWTRGLTDTYGTLTDGTGNETVAIDDDGGLFFNFAIERVLEPGTYYLEVEGARLFTTGGYALHATFEPQPETPPRPRFSVDKHLGDFNGDGTDDVLLRHTDGTWHYYAMNGGEVVEAESGEAEISTDLDDHLAGIGDFNGDGKDDVLLRNIDGTFHLTPMDGRKAIVGQAGDAEITSDLEYIVAGIGDLNGDDKADVLLRHESHGSWLVYAMDGKMPIKEVTGSANLSIDLDYSIAGISDFNGDGKADVLLRHSLGDWYLYLMDGRRFVVGSGPVTGLPSDLAFELVAVGDFGGDAHADAVLSHTDGTWHFYALNGREVLAAENTVLDVTLEEGEQLLAFGDLNGDGAEDLLFRDSEGGWHYAPLNGREVLEGGGEIALNIELDWALPIHGDPSQLRPGKIVGTVRIASGQTLDGDTLDAGKAFVNDVSPNNTRDEAQRVLVPASIGGWASAIGDATDVYRIVFPAPVRISLAIADGEEADLDLYLSAPDGSIIEQSLGVDDLEVIQTSLEGEYLVLVSAYSGASNYSLVVNLADVPTGASGVGRTSWSKDGDFVPGELLAINSPRGATVDEQPIDTLRRVAQEFHFDAEDHAFSGGSLLTLGPGPAFLEDTRPLRDAGFQFGSEELEHKAATLLMRKRLMASGEIGVVQPNYIYQTMAVPNDEDYSRQWHYPEIALEQAWDITKGSDDVVVAVVDTGVVTDHPDIANRLLRDENDEIVGYDFVSDPDLGGDGDGADSDPYDVGDGARGVSSSFHGTHVAGTVGADTDNGEGVAGVMWNGKIMPVRVLGVGGSGTSKDVIEGIRYAAGLENASEGLPEQRANVINLSLGLPNALCLPQSGDLAQELAVREAIEAGVVVVHAAGNDDCYRPDPLSSVEGVISVGATNYLGYKSSYSNYGPEIDVVAPGGDILYQVHSTVADDSGETLRHIYRGSQGTSMAAPHMAGVVGLMLSANPDLTSTDINRLIAGNHSDPAAAPIVRDFGFPGRDDIYGHGLIDAYRAVRTAKVIAGGTIDDEPTGPVLRVSPSNLNFGASTTRLRVRTVNLGSGSLRVESADSDESWIRVNLEELPNLVVEVDRRGRPEGTLVGEVRVVSNGGNATLRVSAQVQAHATPSDIGTVYVALIDPGVLELQDLRATNSLLEYAFESLEVPPGQYWIIAGTDRDGDGSICDPGEACGMYPVLGNPNTITVDGDRRVNFGVTIDLFAQVSSQSTAFPGIASEGFKIPEAPRAGE